MPAAVNAAVAEEVAAAAKSGQISTLKDLPYNSSAAVVCAIWLIFNIWYVHLIEVLLGFYLLTHNLISQALYCDSSETQAFVLPFRHVLHLH